MKDSGEAYDMMNATDIIPLGVIISKPDTVSIRFRSSGQFPRTDYLLIDNETKRHYELDDDNIRLPINASSVGRFEIRHKKSLGHETNNPTNAAQIRITGNQLVVTHADGLHQFTVYNSRGQQLIHQNCHGNQQAEATLPPGIAIITLETTGGVRQSFKVVVF